MSEPRRDHNGRPYILLPDGSRETTYTRVTTVAKALDTQDALIPWKATAAVVGAMRRPGLRAQWQALIAEHSNPWYSCAESKSRCKKLVEECAEAGGSSNRAEIGTALHKVTQFVDEGTLNPSAVDPEMQRDVDAYLHATTGMTFSHVEAFVVLDDYRVAGTADRIGRLPDGRNVILDIKTGDNLDYSWRSISVQLAAYSRGVLYDPEHGRFPLPADLDLTTGVVIHLPAGEGRCDLYEVDLTRGWEKFQRSLEVMEWRKCRDLHRLMVPPVMQAPLDLGAAS